MAGETELKERQAGYTKETAGGSMVKEAVLARAAETNYLRL